MSKKVIAVISGSLNKGGTEKVTSVICNHLAECGHKVFLYLIYNSTIAYDLHPDIVLVPTIFKHKILRHLSVYLAIKKINPEIVFCTLTGVNFLVGSIRPLLSKKIRFIARESNILSYHLKKIADEKKGKKMVKKYYPRFDCLIVQSEAMKKDFIENFELDKNLLHRIYDPINPNQISFEQNKNDDDIPVFITVANLKREKGYLRVLTELKKVKIDYRYIIAGEGKERTAIEKYIEENGLSEKVILLGSVKNPFEYLVKADIYIQGSYYEGFPNSLLEANICGVPIVTYRTPGGTEELVTEGINGFFIDESIPHGFERTLQLALKSQLERKGVRNHIIKTFSHKSILDNYLKTITGNK